MDAAGELAQLLGRVRQLGDRFVRHRGGCLRGIGQLRPGRAQRQRDRDQALLGAVVQVAPDLATGLVLGGDDPRPLRLQLLALGHVEDHSVEARGSLRPGDLLAALEHPGRRPVRADDAVLEPERPIGRRRLSDPAVHLLAIVRVDDAPERAPRALDEVGRGVARDPLDLVADHRHRPVGVERAAVDGAGNVRDDGGQLPVAFVRLHAARSTESPNRRILHRLFIAHAPAPPGRRRRGTDNPTPMTPATSTAPRGRMAHPTTSKWISTCISRNREGEGMSSFESELNTGRRVAHTGALARMYSSFARHPWRVIGAWLAIFVVLAGLNTAFHGKLTDEFKLPGSDVQKATDLVNAKFGGQKGAALRVVVAAPPGQRLDTPARAAAV